jgi:predicted metalloprotease with PDZ domain
LEFAAKRKTIAELELPSEWAGQSHLEDGIRNFKAMSADTILLDTPQSNIKTLRFPTNSLVAVSYDLVKDWAGPLEYPKQFRPVLEREFFEFNTQNALVHPQLGPNDIVTAIFDWQNVPDQWKIVTSFGANSHHQTFTGPWHKVKNALFAGGSFRVYSAKVADEELVVAIRGEWPFRDEEAVNKIQKIIGAERTFWHDKEFPYYLVTLKPFESNSGSSDGSAFTNAFWLYLPRDSVFSYGIQNLLTHESFHAWNPYKMGPIPQPAESIHWFTEGFTVYYSDLLLLRTGLLSPSEYLSKLNRKIADYELSPVKGLSNDEIVARHEHENSVDELTYIRGAVTALWLDAQIRKHSGGSRSLDDLMLRLKDEAIREPERLLTTKHILSTTDEYLGRRARHVLRDMVNKGTTVPVPSVPLNTCVHLSVDQVPIFDLGFDKETLLSKNHVSGVNPDSAAFKAGIRDGQQIVGASIYWDDVGKPIRLKIRSGDSQQIIEYFPTGKPVPIPQYHLQSKQSTTTPGVCQFSM